MVNKNTLIKTSLKAALIATVVSMTGHSVLAKDGDTITTVVKISGSDKDKAKKDLDYLKKCYQ